MLSLALYFFSIGAVASSMGVVIFQNPIHSVLCLILAFINAGGIFLTMHVEFLAFAFIMVYVGAIAVLFLFMVMTLDIKKTPIVFYLSSGLISFILILEISWIILHYKKPLVISPQSFSLKDLGQVLYTHYFAMFQLIGIILFIAMAGTIILIKKKPLTFVKKQKTFHQINRTPETTLSLCRPPLHAGVSIPKPFEDL